MLRSGETFDCLKCFDCGTMQIADVPDDLGRYYADDNYSFDVSFHPLLRRALHSGVLRSAQRLLIGIGRDRGFRGGSGRPRLDRLLVPELVGRGIPHRGGSRG